MKTLPISFITCAAVLLAAQTTSATPIAPTQNDLLNFQDITGSFGGTGSLNQATAVGTGVEYRLTLGTTDFGKTPIGTLNGDVDSMEIGSDLSAYTLLRYRVEVIAADAAIEVNPFFQDSDYGFSQSLSGVMNVGDVAIIDLPLTGDLSDVKGVGFQFFTAGGVSEPDAIDAVVLITGVPEPASAGFLAFAASALLVRRRGR